MLILTVYATGHDTDKENLVFDVELSDWIIHLFHCNHSVCGTQPAVHIKSYFIMVPYNIQQTCEQLILVNNE